MAKINIEKNIVFYGEKNEWKGAHIAADSVRQDMYYIFREKPKRREELGQSVKTAVIYGTIGKSRWIDELEKQGALNLEKVRGKWEVYQFQIVKNVFPQVENAIVIVGSDKRGTIYGLYHLSELLGVSPLIHWNHVWPAKRDSIVLDESANVTTKEPSVRYRGFFINDEWPAFGTWAEKHFGGINAKCYAQIFELLLRLKGNYLWPAMWASNFSLDGPGLASAQLADDMGVVMGTSHHEPCMRAGVEYGMMRGKDSPYGDAWSFLENEKGISKFWEDGLKRNALFENVITMGMRGENDTAILEKESTVEENVKLLRNVLRTQNRLIRENVNCNLAKVPRVMVLFTEVEGFFYGGKESEGLLHEPELDGVTIMLSDNNQGATRTLPTKEMRGHKGGYGMYYHMDMHGGPMAFEWIGSTYLPKVWEQMTAAYEYGVRDIWVTNVGDLATQEYGLSFFLDLAYDIEKWGGQDAAITKQYTKKWIYTQFDSCFNYEFLQKLEDVVWDYNQLLARRKHEVMNEKVYHPLHFGEAEEVLEISEKILAVCEEGRKKCPKEWQGAFESLIYYPACGTANLMKMWILAGRNALYASQNRIAANALADEVQKCLEKDETIVLEYHEVDNGAFDGFGLSEHIGFVDWNSENCKYPVRNYVSPIREPRMIVARKESAEYLTGGYWTERPQTWSDAMRNDVTEIRFEIACGSREPVEYEIRTDAEWLHFSSYHGVCANSEEMVMTIDKTKISGTEKALFTVENKGYGKAEIYVEVREQETDIPAGFFVEDNGYIAMEARHFAEAGAVEGAAFHILEPYGRTGSAIKVFPVTADFSGKEECPFAAYDIFVHEEGTYETWFYMSATTPVVYESRQDIGYSVNDGKMQVVNTVKEPDKPFFLSRQWTEEAHDQIKICKVRIHCKKGANRLYFYHVSPAVLLEKIVVCREDVTLPESYLGPRESFRR